MASIPPVEPCSMLPVPCMPPMESSPPACSNSARTCSGVRPVPSTQSSRTAIHSVVPSRLLGVIDDQDAVEATVQLNAGVRVVEVRARVRCRELVAERDIGGDRVLSHARHNVHVVAKREAVPVHARALGKRVLDIDAQDVAGVDSEQRRGRGVAVRPCVHGSAAKVQRHRPRGEPGGDEPASGLPACRLCRGYRVGGGDGRGFCGPAAAGGETSEGGRTARPAAPIRTARRVISDKTVQLRCSRHGER